ncbi:MerR family transcriptional regulator [Iodobacter fluviatilis]|uniref:Multidrug-efflux transporter 1 regulator n=1 Tax=Iodobacter fluviatilis TaxID=537 RepID=A0A377Q4J8_9NEIS|nr:GyrI-like domain-containing protein [Iodobacter fluviatilis]TCU90492.1 putative transcriptional regulator YdeE [Iodobacter fluviatilis]STQ89519.1 Multidrug-efflux transporter 1 regulator [Iodobacter fluviatilis]
MLTIGQLARCYGLSTKTLRHYDSIGLFSPALTGSDNGYRYYLPAQVTELGQIVRLRQFGLPLEEIRQLWQGGTDDQALRQLLQSHSERLQSEIKDKQEQITQIQIYLSQAQRSPAAMQTPEIITRAAFRVIGLAWSPKDEGSIPEMWGRFLQREHEIADLRPGSSYGLCQPLADGQWRYLAALEVAADAPVPDGMVALEVPEQRYARFEHIGPVSGIAETFRSIHSSWLPAAGLKALDSIEFEYMDQRFLAPDHPDSVTELFIPI